MVEVVSIDKVDKTHLYLEFKNRRDRNEFYDFIVKKMKETKK